MDWLTHHRKSEAFAASAHEHLRQGLAQQAQDAFRQAAEAEETALPLLDQSKPRTLGITAVSAVSLWFKGQEFERAALLAHRYLAVAIDETTRPRLASVLKAEQPKPDEASGEVPAELVGVLRALDLDKDWLKVETEDGSQFEVGKLSQAVDDVIGPMVNKRVVVRAIKSKKGNLRFADIELAED